MENEEIGIQDIITDEVAPQVQNKSDDSTAEEPNCRTPCKGYLETRCTVRKFVDLVHSFDNAKVNVVKDLGFDGILQLKIQNLKNSLIEGLAQRFDLDSCELCVHGGKIKLTPDYVEQTLGLPSKGLKVQDNMGSCSDDVLVRYNITKKFNISNLFKELQELPANEEFKAKFLLFAIGTIIAPNTSTSLSRSYFGLLQDLSKIQKMNWAKFIIDGLVNGIQKFCETDFGANKKRRITGCVLILQFLYFEHISVRYTSLSINRRERPSIQFWDNITLANVWAKVKSYGDLDNTKIKLLEEYDIEAHKYFEVKTEMVELRNEIKELKCETLDALKNISKRREETNMEKLQNAGDIQFLKKANEELKKEIRELKHEVLAALEQTRNEKKIDSVEIIQNLLNEMSALKKLIIQEQEKVTHAQMKFPYCSEKNENLHEKSPERGHTNSPILKDKNSPTLQPPEHKKFGEMVDKEDCASSYAQLDNDVGLNFGFKSKGMRAQRGKMKVNKQSQAQIQLPSSGSIIDVGIKHYSRAAKCDNSRKTTKVKPSKAIISPITADNGGRKGRKRKYPPILKLIDEPSENWEPTMGLENPMKEICDVIFEKTFEDAHIICHIGAEYATHKAVCSLKPRQWVDSQVINVLINALLLHEKKSEVGWKRWYLPSHFSIFIPINDNELHWYLLVVNIKEVKALIYDSKQLPDQSPREETVKKLLGFLDELLALSQFQMEENATNHKFSNFPIVTVKTYQQPNTFDCGVYVLHYLMEDSKGEHDEVLMEIHENTRRTILAWLILNEANKERDRIVWVAIAHRQQKERRSKVIKVLAY